jgi:hypothetical protein
LSLLRITAVGDDRETYRPTRILNELNPCAEDAGSVSIKINSLSLALIQSRDVSRFWELSNVTWGHKTVTIFTPTQTGLYRLSVYATISKADPTSNSYWLLDLQWTDDGGSQQWEGGQLLYANSNAAFPFVVPWGSTLGGMSMPLELKAGQPITYDVTQQESLDNSAYSLYYTLERLE